MSNPFELKPTLPPRGMLLCLIGPPGVGKSSFAAQWPGARAVIDPRDEGMIDLIHEGLIPLKLEHVYRSASYTEYRLNLTKALNEPDCKSIICESADGIQDLCYDHCSQTDHGGDLGPKSWLNYQAGPIQSDNKYFKSIIDTLQVCQNRGKHAIFIGHTKTAPVKNPGGDDWLAATMSCNERFSNRIGKTFSNIFHIVDLVNTTGRTEVKKGSSESTRFVYTTANPQYFAKNRMGLMGGFAFPSNPKDAYLKFCEVTKRNPKTGYRTSL